MALDPGSGALGLATGIGISNTFTAFSTFTPDLSDLREGGTGDADLVKNLRHGEVCGVIVGAGVALAASAITGSILPFLTSVALLALLITMYEYTLRGIA